MTIFFVADIHLQIKNPIITSCFLHFLYNKAKSADAIYILGDLFETWIGDDDPTPLYHKVAAAINKLVRSGIPCYFIHGNHDFLLGQNFANESGMILLPEEQVSNIYGRKMLIMHGDTLCTDDTNYQTFRMRTRNYWIKKIFLALPLFIRRYIVVRMRKNITAINKLNTIVDVNQKAVIQAMEKHNVQWLIHGHTHPNYPIVHNFIANGSSAYRVTLGAWHNNGSLVEVKPKSVKITICPF